MPVVCVCVSSCVHPMYPETHTYSTYVHYNLCSYKRCAGWCTHTHTHARASRYLSDIPVECAQAFAHGLVVMVVVVAKPAAATSRQPPARLACKPQPPPPAPSSTNVRSALVSIESQRTQTHTHSISKYGVVVVVATTRRRSTCV